MFQLKNTFDEVIKKIKKENKLKKLLDIASTKELYAFFQQNGYSKSKNEFEVELENRLKEVAVSLKDSELSKVVGGKKNLTKLTSAGIASLLVLGASPICSKASASDTTCVPDLKTAQMRRLAREDALRNETENQKDIIERNFGTCSNSLGYNQREIISTLASQLSGVLGSNLSDLVCKDNSRIPFYLGVDHSYINYACCAVKNYFLGTDPRLDLLGNDNLHKCAVGGKNYFVQTSPFNMLNRLIISLGFANFDNESELQKAKECVEILRNSLKGICEYRSFCYNFDQTVLSTKIIDLLQITIKDGIPFDWSSFGVNEDIYKHFACLLIFLVELKDRLPYGLRDNFEEFTVRTETGEYKLKDLLLGDSRSILHSRNCILCINDEAKTEIPLNNSHLELSKITTECVRDTLKRVYGIIPLEECNQNFLETLYELAKVAEENELFDAKAFGSTRIRFESPQRALCFLVRKIWEHSVSTSDKPYRCYNPSQIMRLLAAKVAVERDKITDDKKQRLINFIEKFINCYSSSYGESEIEEKNVISLLISSIKDPEITLNKEYLLKIFSLTEGHSPENNTIDGYWLAHELKEFGITIPD